MATNAVVDHEIELLKAFIKRLGKQRPDGKFAVPFGVLYDDEQSQQTFEALAGTLKAAKKRGAIDYASPLLLKGPHDKVDVVLLIE